MQADLLLDWLDWAGNECREVEQGIREGFMTADDASDYLSDIQLELGRQASELDSERRPEAIKASRFETDQPTSTPAPSENRRPESLSAGAHDDFATEDDRNKRRPFRLFIVDLTNNKVIESPHKLSKRETIDMLENWKTRKEQAVLIFWPDYATSEPPFSVTRLEGT